MMLNNILLAHQNSAVEKMMKIKVGALFMEQGTGKTITTLEIARRRLESGKINSVIWLCPCSAKDNIRREIVKQCPEEMYRVFTICGIETLSTSIRANSYLLNLTEEKKCFLVVDESLLTKNPKTYRTKNILKISEKCPYRIILNGTPISRNEADLFAQFYLLDWRILGYKTYWSFSANHLEYDDYGKLKKVLNKDFLAKKISPYAFQITKAECMDLPAKEYSNKYFCLEEVQWKEYQRVAEKLLLEINEWKPETVYRLFSALQAVISGKYIIFNKSGSHFTTQEMFNEPLENPRIRRTVEQLNDEKTIVFCRYESEISQLCSLYPKETARFDGKVSQKARYKALQEFAGDKKYLIANRNCAGFSLNLQFCHRIINMSNDWNLGTRLQSEDRVHRIGQEHTVEIIDVCAEGTLDEKILDCLNRKENLLDNIKNSLKDANEEKLKETLKRSIYGSRYEHEVFDCSELEEENA